LGISPSPPAAPGGTPPGPPRPRGRATAARPPPSPRPQMEAFVYDKELVASVFEEAPKRYADRNGGYCRVVRDPRRRRGDNAEMATIELV